MVEHARVFLTLGPMVGKPSLKQTQTWLILLQEIAAGWVLVIMFRIRM